MRSSAWPTDGPSDEEMEKLRNTLSNDAVRGRQSTIYRAQRIAEYTLYDGDPTLFDHELDYYLKVTADQIKAVTAKYLDVDNRVVLDVVPAMLAEASETAASGSTQSNGESPQPAAPAPQVPAGPKTSRRQRATLTLRSAIPAPQSQSDHCQSHRLPLNLAQDQYTREYESTGRFSPPRAGATSLQ